jgi:hypothetical protein
MRWVVAMVIFAACGEEPAPYHPPMRTAPREQIAYEPSPVIVSPHVRRVPNDGRDAIPLRPPGTGGGSGHGPDEWRPRPAPPPSERQVAEFRQRLDQAMAEHPAEPDDDECERYFAVLRATAEANERPGHRGPEIPTRPELRENCRGYPQAFRECMSPEYFRDHVEECQREMDDMAARGRRRRESAERQMEDMRAGRQPWPGQQQPRDPSAPRPPPPDEDDEDG